MPAKKSKRRKKTLKSKKIQKIKKFYSRNRLLRLDGSIDKDFKDRVKEVLDECVESEDHKTPLTIVLDSTGGRADMAYSVFDAIRATPFKVIVIVEGVVASSAIIILLAGDERLMTKYSRLILHDLSTGIESNYSIRDIDVPKIDFQATLDRYLNIASSRTKLSKELIDLLMKKTSHLTAEEALRFGFIDEILEE